MFRYNIFSESNFFKEKRLAYEITPGTGTINVHGTSPEEGPSTEDELTILGTETEGLRVRTALQRRIGIEESLSREEEIANLSDVEGTMTSTLFTREFVNENGVSTSMTPTEKFTLFKIAEEYLYQDGLWDRLDLRVDDFGRLVITGRSLLDVFASDHALNTVGFKAVVRNDGRIRWVLADRANLGPRQTETGSFTQFYEDELVPNMSNNRVNDNMSESESAVLNDLHRWMRTESILANSSHHPDVSEIIANSDVGAQLEDTFVAKILRWTMFEGENFSYTPMNGQLAQMANNLGINEVVGSLAWNLNGELVFTTPGNKIFAIPYEELANGKYDLDIEAMQEIDFDDPRANIYFAALPEVRPPAEVPSEELVRTSLIGNLEIPIVNADGEIFTMENGIIPGSNALYNASEMARRVEATLRDHPEYFVYEPNLGELKEIAYYIATKIVEKVYTDNGNANFEVRFSAKYGNVDSGNVELNYRTQFEAERMEQAETREFLSQTFQPEITHSFTDNGNAIEYTGNPNDFRILVEENLSNPTNRDKFFREDPAVTEATDYIMGLFEPQLATLPAGATIFPTFTLNEANPEGLTMLNTPEELREKALEAVDTPLELTLSDPENSENYGYIEYTHHNEELHTQLDQMVYAAMQNPDMWVTPGEPDLQYARAITDMIVVDTMQHLNEANLQEGDLIKIDYFLEGRNSEPRISVLEFTDEDEALLAVVHENIDPITFGNEHGADGFFAWTEESPAHLRERILEMISTPSQAADILEDYSLIEADQETVDARLEAFADYAVAGFTAQLEKLYPNGIRDAHEFKFTFSRNSENPSGKFEIHEREEYTLDDSYAALKNGTLFGLEISRFRDTPVGLHELEIQIRNELIENKDNYFEEPNNPNLAEIADNLAQEWAREFSNSMNISARNYEGTVELAAYTNRGTQPRFEVVNSEEILRRMEQQERTLAIQERYEEHSRRLGPLAWLVTNLNPDIGRQDIAAELAAREVDGLSTTIFLLSLLSPFRAFRSRVRDRNDILDATPHQRAEGERTPHQRVGREELPNLADDFNMQTMDNLAMASILASTPPTADETRSNQNTQGYRFEDFRLEAGTQIRLLDAQVQVENLSDLNNVEFLDSDGSVIHITRPNTPPYIVDFGEREVFIRPRTQNGAETVLSMDIVGKLTYFNSDQSEEQPLEAPDAEPANVA